MDTWRRGKSKVKPSNGINTNSLENGYLSCQTPAPIFFYLKFRHLAVVTVWYKYTLSIAMMSMFVIHNFL